MVHPRTCSIASTKSISLNASPTAVGDCVCVFVLCEVIVLCEVTRDEREREVI